MTLQEAADVVPNDQEEEVKTWTERRHRARGMGDPGGGVIVAEFDES